MAFNQKEQEIIKYGAANGKTRAEVEQAILNYRTGIVPKKKEVEKPSIVDTVKEYATEAVTNPVETLKGVVKGVPGGAAQFTKMLEMPGKAITGAVFGENAPKGLDYTAVEELTQPSNKAQQVGYVAGTLLPIERAVGATEFTYNVLKNISPKTKTAYDAVSELSSKVDTKNILNKATDIISNDPGDKVATILKRSTPQELDNYLSVAEKSSQSGEAKTVLETVGDKMYVAAQDLNTKLGNIGAEKSAVMSKYADIDFAKQTDDFVKKLEDLKKTFTNIDAGDATIVEKIIADAKATKTTGQADVLIDKVQDAIYKSGINLTIPKGSALEKKLQRLLGEYNSNLKKVVPEEYATLNKQYSELVDTIDVLNRGLGEVVEGTPIRGASLVKQYFSPAGSRTKELFEFIKRETNGEIDLAKDATLAKFAGQLYGDDTVNSLLSGIKDIPTTPMQVVTKVAERFGGKKVEEEMRKSTIRKAKELTKPSFNLGTVPKTVKAFNESKKIKDFGNFVLGSFGRNAYKRKELNIDRFPESQLEETLKNIKEKYRASIDDKSYRKDNIAWISKMPNGELRVIYTRLNSEGKEEIINWHKISKDKYLVDLSKNGAPGRTRTSNPFVRTE